MLPVFTAYIRKMKTSGGREKTLRLLANKCRGKKMFNLLNPGGGNDIFDGNTIFYRVIQQIVAVIDDQ